MKAIYVKAKEQFWLRDVALREIECDEVLIRVEACGFCGSEIRIAREAEDWTAIGHEVAGVVERVGSYVTHVKAGDRVALESGSYDRFSALSRDGKMDWDNTGRHFWSKKYPGESMGFAEYVIAPEEVCVRYENMSLEAACMIEPMGVAYDVIKVADIGLGDSVMVVGIGAIGLMALRLAKLRGASRIYAVNTSGRDARDNIARKWGAEVVLHNDKDDILSFPYEKGVDKILFTTPPNIIPDFVDILNIGGIMVFIGGASGEAGKATFEMSKLHLKKLQLRASYAAPALFFPACMDLYHRGLIDLDALHTHDLRLQHFEQDYRAFMEDRAGAIKAILYNKP